ncbi:uncharacterized protein LOC106649816 [Trichogramma pretiosum]|uniref:uncharacterized protein LOC106649816 n=1 Tax=Trichogramma pretiosum TaxID=7493 RepID=UPI000C71C77B|nr:uncharacterized protein LOC106649816 [Trichogramma pretiosum]
MKVLNMKKTSQGIFELMLMLFFFKDINTSYSSEQNIQYNLPTFKKSEFLPVIAKCCNSNEVLIPSEHEKMQCIKWNSTIFFEPIFYNFNKTGILSSGSRYKNVNTIIGTPCSSERLKYILDPVQFTDDSYYLLSNGSIFAPNYVPFMFEPGVDYCIEEIPGIGISVIICISPAFIIQYCSLTCFFWSNILSIETYIQVKHQIDHNSHKLLKRKEEQIHLYYSLWAWGLPMIFTLSLWALKNEPSLPRNILKRNIHSYDCCKYCE